MSSGSSIAWTEATWNPTTGCTRVSAGCDHCYAVKMSHRLGVMAEKDIAAGRDPGRKRDYMGLTVLNKHGDRHFNGVVKCHDEALEIPLGWKKPRRIFVNSMSDLFHRDVPFEFVDRVFAVMALCPQHTFQVLTKRPERMAEYLAGCVDRLEWLFGRTGLNELGSLGWFEYGSGLGNMCSVWCSRLQAHARAHWWPLPNVWLGTSVENQQAADERIPYLLGCPAAVRWLSVEPMLGRVNLMPFACAMNGERVLQGHWVVFGVESRNGKNVGRFPDEANAWILNGLTQCRRAAIPAFCKQIVVKRGNKLMVSEDHDCGWPAEFRIREWPKVPAA